MIIRIFSICLVLLLFEGCFRDQNFANNCNGQREFNIPQGYAQKTLAVAASQANIEIFVTLEEINDVVTKRVCGRYSPQKAFELMLSGTDLELIKTQNQKIFSIKRKGKSHSYLIPVDYFQLLPYYYSA